ncbi:MAG: ABC transporter permease [Firmicutes bacterium]|nr:ABC transporter permease [Bacillota bacterium]
MAGTWQDLQKECVQPCLNGLGYAAYLIRQNTLTRVGTVIVLLLVLIGILAPVLAPYPDQAAGTAHPSTKLLSPRPGHWMGTDELGRDLLSRVLYGTRISLQIGMLAVGLSLLIGVPLGLVAGYRGGWTDEVIMRLTDIFLSFPPLLLAIAIAAFLGPSLTNAMIAIALSWWPWYTRIARSQAMSVRERPFVEAAQTIGTAHPRIVMVHILPNSLAPIIVQASMDFGSVVLTAAALSFLGLGAQPPTPEWGLMLSTSRNYFFTAWWYGLFPGLAIFVTVLVFNLLGDGLREILDPKARRA